MVVATKWDATLLATRDLTPAHSQAVVLTWEDFPDVDGGVPGGIASPLALAMTSLGEVCFRVRGAVPSGARVVGTVRTTRLPFAPAWNVIGSRDAETVLACFENGWAEGGQTALIGASTDARAREVLGSKQLNALLLEEGELTFSAIVDGAGMLIAACDSALLERALVGVEHQCRDAGIDMRR